MNLNYAISFAVFILFTACASQQAPQQNDAITVEQGEEIISAPANSEYQESADGLKLKTDLMAFEKENFLDEKLKFEEQRFEILKGLNQRDSLLSIREKDLQSKTFQLELREQVVEDKLAKIEHGELSNADNITRSTSSSAPAVVREQASVKSSPNAGFNKRASDLKAHRYIQFVASTGGKNYEKYAYLGEVVTEQIPGKNIYRYKIKGRFDDFQVREVITTLKADGFQGAFEVK